MRCSLDPDPFRGAAPSLLRSPLGRRKEVRAGDMATVGGISPLCLDLPASAEALVAWRVGAAPHLGLKARRHGAGLGLELGLDGASRLGSWPQPSRGGQALVAASPDPSVPEVPTCHSATACRLVPTQPASSVQRRPPSIPFSESK